MTDQEKDELIGQLICNNSPDKVYSRFESLESVDDESNGSEEERY